MAPSAVEMIGKKKRRRGKKGEASTSVPASGVHASKQRRRRMQRKGPQAPGACTLFSFI
jgi:hypothetical protein